MTFNDKASVSPPCGLGIDAGGTQTRWALADATGEIVASGQVAGLTALQMSTEAGVQHIRETVAHLAVAARAIGQPARVYAGLTGFSKGGESLRTLIANALGVNSGDVVLCSDIEITGMETPICPEPDTVGGVHKFGL